MRSGTRIPLTVIIPCRNAAHTLKPLLEGIGQQTLAHDQFEVIVVDDGSTDSTPSVVAAFPFARLITLCVTPRGPGEARNVGMAEARGDVILFLDADLSIPEHLFEAHLSFHKLNPEIAAAGGSVLPAHGGWFAWAMADHFSTWFLAHPHVRYAASPEFLPSLNFSIKRELIIDRYSIRWQDGLKHTGEDVVFCHAIRSRGMVIGFIPEAWVRHKDRETLRGFLKHQYRFGYHAPFVRGSIEGLKYGFLFPRNPVFFPLTLPAIVLGYTVLIWKSWLNVHPLLVSAALPQLLIGRIAYGCGVVKGTLSLDPPALRARRAS